MKGVSILCAASLSFTALGGLDHDTEWNYEDSVVDSGTNLVARTTWSLNDDHGQVSDPSPGRLEFTVHVSGGALTGLPPMCSPESSLAAAEGVCVLDLPDDDGLSGTLDFPVRAMAGHGDQVAVEVHSSDGAVSVTDPILVSARRGYDVALNQVVLNPLGEVFVPGGEMASIIPIMVSVPGDGAPIDGPVTIDLDFEHFRGVNPLENLTSARIVPLEEDPRLTGIPANTDNFGPPPVSINVREAGISLRVDPAGMVIPPTHDPNGERLHVIPQAVFGLELTYPVMPTASSVKNNMWQVNLRESSATIGAEILTEEMYTDNDTAISAKSTTGSGSAVFEHEYSLVEPDGDPSDPLYEEFVDPTMGTGALVPGAGFHGGQGAVVAGDQVIGRVETQYLVGRDPSSFDPSDRYGYCLVFDREHGTTQFNGRVDLKNVESYTLEYLHEDIAGGFLDPDCGAGNWSTDMGSIEDVVAIRAIFAPAELPGPLKERATLRAGYLISETLEPGDVAWMTGRYTDRLDETWKVVPTLPGLVDVGGAYGSTTFYRDSLIVVPSRSSVSLTPDHDTASPGAVTTWRVSPVVTGMHAGANRPVSFRLTLPAGLTFNAGIDGFTPVVSDGDNGQVLTWSSEQADHAVSFTTRHTGGSGTFTVDLEMTDPTRGEPVLDSASISIHEASRTRVLKETAATEFGLDGSNAWSVTVENHATQVLGRVDTIDVLPYDGDSRGTSTSAKISVTGIDGEGADVYVSTADPQSLDPDPAAGANGQIGDPSDLWEAWNGQEGVTAVRWVHPAIDPGVSHTYRIDYETEGGTAGDTLVNSVQTRPGSGDRTMVSSRSTTMVGDPSALQVSKIVAADQRIVVGEQIDFVVTVRSGGPGTVHDAVVVDHGLAGIEDLTFVDVPVGRADGATWYIGEISEGEELEATVRGTVTDLTITNQIVGGTCDGECEVPPMATCIPNVDAASDTDSCDETTVKEQSDLRINKELVGSLPAGGQEVEYLLTVANLAEPAPGVVTTAAALTVSDMPGDGLSDTEFVDGSQTLGEIVDGQWVIEALPAGEQHTIRVRGLVDEGTTSATNAAWVSNPASPRHLDNPDDAQPNVSLDDDTDQADVVTASESGRLAMAKHVEGISGETITYRLEVANLGRQTLTDVVMEELPGDGLTGMTLLDPEVGEVHGLSWHIGDLPAGARTHVWAIATISAETVINQAYVDAPGSPHEGGLDPNDTVEEDTDQGVTTITTPGRADLRIVKETGAHDQGVQEFTITVCNVGTVDASDVIVVDEGGRGVESIGSTDDRFEDGTFTLGTLPANSCEMLPVAATVSESGSNAAYVDSPDDPVDLGTRQPNLSIDDDIDGWDASDYAVPGSLARTGAIVQWLAGLALLTLVLGSIMVYTKRREN